MLPMRNDWKQQFSNFFLSRPPLQNPKKSSIINNTAEITPKNKSQVKVIMLLPSEHFPVFTACHHMNHIHVALEILLKSVQDGSVVSSSRLNNGFLNNLILSLDSPHVFSLDVLNGRRLQMDPFWGRLNLSPLWSFPEGTHLLGLRCQLCCQLFASLVCLHQFRKVLMYCNVYHVFWFVVNFLQRFSASKYLNTA